MNGKQQRYCFKEGLKDGIPLIIGFIPVAMAFGVLARSVGVSLMECFLLSACVFAGSSQFIALNLLAIGTGFGEIVLTTLFVNSRHFLMSTTIAHLMSQEEKYKKPLMAFGIIDEVFSVASLKDGQITDKYMFGLQLAAYSSWVGGSIAGYLVGGFLPAVIATGMGVALYALFVVLLISAIKKTSKALVVAVTSGALNMLGVQLIGLPQGWSILFSIIIASVVGMLIFSREEKLSYE